MLTAHTAKRQLPISTKIRERKSGENLIDIFLCSTFRGEQHPRRLFILFCGMTSQTQFQTKLLAISNFFPYSVRKHARRRVGGFPTVSRAPPT